MRSRTALIVALLLFPMRAAPGQCPTWAEGFFRPGVQGTVRALAYHDPGAGARLYVGGSFALAGGQPAANLASWDGASWAPVGGGVDNAVAALLPFDDGAGGGMQLYAGGSFGVAGGLAVSNIARWNGTSWSGVGSGFNNAVLALAVHDDGSGPALYASGLFTFSGATPRARVAKWNGTSWSPLLSGLSAVAHALCTFDDGSGAALYAGGEFTVAGGVLAQFVARWNGTSWSNLGSGMDGTVYALKVFQDTSGPRLFAGGNFVTAGGVPASYVARWNGASWSSLSYPFPNTVYALEVHDDGGGPALFTGSAVGTQTGASAPRIHRYAAGSVTEVTNTVGMWTYALLSVPNLAGGPNDFAVGTSYGVFLRSGATWSAPGPGQSLWFYPSVFQAFGAGALGGPRIFIGGVASPASIASWDGQQFRAESLPLPPFEVHDMAVLDGGTGARLFVSGRNLNGSSRALQAYDGATWSIIAVSGTPSIGSYEELAVHDDGSGPALYVAGGNTYSLNISRFDGLAWTGVGAGLNSVVSDMLTWTSPNGPVLVACGYFTYSGSVAIPARVASWDGTSWSPIGTALTNYRVTSLAQYDSGSGPELYASGQRFTPGFYTMFIARWDGANWIDIAATSPGTSQADTLHLVPFDDGSGGGTELYALGGFPWSGGALQFAAKWDGVRWKIVDAGFDNLPSGSAVILGADGVEDLWTGGSFSTAGGHASQYLARLDGCGPVSTFCAGDGIDPHVTTDCPCNNVGSVGRGCAWHGGLQGAQLEGSGGTQPDTLVLNASGMPISAPSTIFLKGNVLESAGLVFGDGVRCTAGTLIRLGTKVNVNGVAHYPEAGNAPISVRGLTPPGSGAVGYYQTYYRNAASFCTPATFNVTNGVRVVW